MAQTLQEQLDAHAEMWARRLRGIERVANRELEQLERITQHCQGKIEEKE
jgi:hypothetical protein